MAATEPVLQDQYKDVHFPLAGIDLSQPFDSQPNRPLPTGEGYARTTPVGINVRSYEPSTGRARGGSRPGLSKYINSTVPVGTKGIQGLIQHLNIVVDPDSSAVLGDGNNQLSTDGNGNIVWPPGWFPAGATPPTVAGTTDPTGATIPVGGSGVHIKGPIGGSKIKFIQEKDTGLAGFSIVGGSATPTLTFNTSVAQNDLLLVAIQMSYPGSSLSLYTVTITDTAGTTFNLVGSADLPAGVGLGEQSGILLYQGLCKQSLGSNTVTASISGPGPGGSGSMAILEYTGTKTGSPQDGFNTNQQDATSGGSAANPCNVGTVHVATTRELLFGFFWIGTTGGTTGTMKFAPSGFVQRVNVQSAAFGGYLAAFEKINPVPISGGIISGNVTIATGAPKWFWEGIGASFYSG